MLGRKIWVFCHVPKTAGTTFQREISKAWFPSGRHVFSHRHFSLEEQKRRRDKLALRSKGEGVSYVGGHYVYGLADGLGIPVQHFSFIRDPVSTLVSYWFHHLNKPGGPSLEWVGNKYESCEQFVRGENPLDTYINAYLSVEELMSFDQRFRERFPGCARNSISVINSSIRKDAPDIYDEKTALAFARIDRAIPLISERFDDGLTVLSAVMNKPVISYQRQRETGPSRERDIALEMLPDLQKCHPESMAFYDRQVSRFENLMERRSTRGR